MDAIEFLIRIGAGAGFAAVLGLEREATGKAAGLRTHAMVGLGSALFTVLSIEAFDQADSSRVAAQIVSGIGFLGAGAIFRSGPLVKGLTTAAGLWAAAALGMAAGSGQVAWGALASAAAVLVLLLGRWVDAIIGKRRVGVTVRAVVQPAARFLDVRDHLVSLDPQIELTDVHHDGAAATVRFLVGLDRGDLVCHALRSLDEVSEAAVED